MSRSTLLRQQLNNGNRLRGFTIVELLIVVVVIAILAAITVVAYNGITRNAVEASMKSDLRNAATTLGVKRSVDGSYPAVAEGLQSSEGNTLKYRYSSGEYCLSVSSSRIDKSFQIQSAEGQIKEGSCLSLATAISTGAHHTCALADGSVYCWGHNAYGQLGNGSTSNRSDPSKITDGEIPPAATLKQVAAGAFHTCALDTSNRIYCWGRNNFGQLGDGTSSQRISPVAVAANGTLSGKTVSAIYVGYGHSCALIAGGETFCWGYGASGHLGDGSMTYSVTSPTLVAQGERPGGVAFRQLSLGMHHSCGVGTDEKVYCWGQNTDMQIGDGTVAEYNDEGDVTTNGYKPTPTAVIQGDIPPGVTIQQITAGDDHTCALGSDQNVYCWGGNYYGQLGNGTSGYEHSRAAPTLVQRGHLPTGVNVRQVFAGSLHTCALATDDRAYCWGDNYQYGQLGNGTASNRPSTPRAVVQGSIPEGVYIKELSGGSESTCAITSDGLIYCWGRGDLGQLGDGTTVQRRLTPWPTLSLP